MTSGGSNGTDSAPPAPQGGADEAKITQLTEMGFSRDMALQALMASVRSILMILADLTIYSVVEFARIKMWSAQSSFYSPRKRPWLLLM